MIFLGNLIPITSTKSQVGFIHGEVFDPTNGMGKTQAELESIGILVDSIPTPQPPVGQFVSGTFVDPTTKIVFYEYSSPPLTQDQMITELQRQNAQMLLALVQGGLM